MTALALAALLASPLSGAFGAGVTVAESSGSTDITEGGATDTYTIVLDTQPTADVTITVTPDAESTVDSGTLTFTNSNWDTPQTVTVTAVDDDLHEGAHTSTITHSAASTDGDYDGISINSVTANVTDNDTAGVTVTESSGSTDVTEGGATDTYTVVLDSEPTADVTITVTPDAESTVDSGTLTFTNSNWDTPQTVTVTAVDDDLHEGGHTSTIDHTAASTDGDYDGISVNSVTASVTDNDTAGVTVTESSGSTDITEGGATDTYTVVLDSEPTADVTITVTPDAESTVDSGTLTFTNSNWDTPQTVTVTAVDDSVLEGAHPSTITHTAASTDGDYDGISVSSVTANVTDNDTAGVTVTESSGSTDVTEGGATDTYTVVLSTTPTADVTITVTPDAESTVDSGTLTFTSANWDTPQTVTVTAVDDDIAEGAHTSTITHTAASADGDYDGINVSDVTANITDDDAAGVTITESNGATEVEEGGATDTYTVVLNSEPTADVTITVTPDADATAAPATLTFTSVNWDTAQTVTVTGVDDAVYEGDHSSTIAHTAASADGDYDGIAIADVTAEVTDNEVADDDGDGVANDADDCPNTPASTPVDAHGCEVVDEDDTAGDDGEAEVTTGDISAVFTGLDAGTPVAMETNFLGDIKLTVGALEHPKVILGLTGLDAGSSVSCVVNKDKHPTFGITGVRGDVCAIDLPNLPAASVINIDYGPTGNDLFLGLELSGSSGNFATFSTTKRSEDALLVMRINQSLGLSAGRRVPGNFYGLQDGEAFGPSVTIYAEGLADDAVTTVQLAYDTADLGEGESESDLRLFRLSDERSIYEFAGTHDVGDAAPTDVLDDYGLDSGNAEVWATTNKLGTFAVGIQDEALQDVEEAPVTLVGILCGPLGFTNVLLMLAGVAVMRRHGAYRRR